MKSVLSKAWGGGAFCKPHPEWQQPSLPWMKSMARFMPSAVLGRSSLMRRQRVPRR
jgi:hypothetical protein